MSAELLRGSHVERQLVSESTTDLCIERHDKDSASLVLRKVTLIIVIFDPDSHLALCRRLFDRPPFRLPIRASSHLSHLQRPLVRRRSGWLHRIQTDPVLR